MARLLVPAMMFVSTAVAGCGSSTNFNQIWGGDDDGGDTLLAQAQADYDRGDFDSAEDKTTKLLDRNPDNESAAVLLGYTALSKGGIDPYTLARALNKLESSKKKAATPTTTPEAGGSLADSAEKKTNDTSSTLQELGTLINLSAADFDKLSEKQFDNNGAPRALFGDDNTLRVPAQVTDDLRAKVPVLTQMNKAMHAVCRFVSDTVKTDDPRHKAADCQPSQGPRNELAKAHFLWAFSHLTESLVYQTVLLYQAAGQTETNFQKGAAKVNNASVSDAAALTAFVANVDELNNAVNAVFDTDSETSMIRNTLTSLTAVNLAFGEIAGLPEGMKKRIANVLTKINTLGDTFGGGTSNNTKALKGQLTEKFTKDLGAKIDSAVTQQLQDVPVENNQQFEDAHTNGLITDENYNNVKSMCTSYDDLTGSLDPAKKTGSKPAACP